ATERDVATDFNIAAQRDQRIGDAIPFRAFERLAAHGMNLHKNIWRRASVPRPHIQASRARPTSILATPSIPGRSPLTWPVTSASTLKVFSPFAGVDTWAIPVRMKGMSLSDR